MPPTVARGIEELELLVGQHLGYSQWFEITQERVQQFADATEDQQWIHVDVERARAESPFETTIAHGYLTLALVPFLVARVFTVDGFSRGINYGLNRVRFMAPVPVGASLRAGVRLLTTERIQGGVQYSLEVTVECEGAQKPSCVAETIVRRYK
jgi:acyl dehydratase